MNVQHIQTVPYTPAVWRAIIHRPADGATNMAIDEAIAEAVSEGQAPPTLRFYSWDPACLTLGSFQPITDVDHVRLAAHGWDVVRRLTGGRAILHTDELTYSVAAPEDEPRVAGGVVESYRRLSAGLLAGLSYLDVNVHAERAEPEARGFKGPICFEVPSDYEITVSGKKLLGSAQTRRFGIVMQHGALPLYGDVTRICDALAFPDEDAREEARIRMHERATTVEEALGERTGLARTVQSLMRGFVDELNLTLEEDQLTPWEEARAKELRETKYATEAWTTRH